MIKRILKPLNEILDKDSVIFNAKNISLKLDNELLLNNVSFKILKKNFSFIMGPNGAGKTLLIKIIAGLIKPTFGEVIFNKKVKLGYVSQKPVFLRRSVYQNLYFALRFSNIPDFTIKNRIYEIIRLTKFENFLDFPARKLSLGQQQLLSIIRALTQKPNTLILDEPCSNLDPNATSLIEDLLVKANKSGVKIIFVTHDLMQAKRLSDEVIFMHKGKIIEYSKKNFFFNNSKSKEVSDYLQGKLLK